MSRVESRLVSHVKLDTALVIFDLSVVAGGRDLPVVMLIQHTALFTATASLTSYQPQNVRTISARYARGRSAPVAPLRSLRSK